MAEFNHLQHKIMSEIVYKSSMNLWSFVPFSNSIMTCVCLRKIIFSCLVWTVHELEESCLFRYIISPRFSLNSLRPLQQYYALSLSLSWSKRAMGRQPCCEKVGLKRGPWTIEEDNKLMNFILNNGIQCWRLVPKLAGTNSRKFMALLGSI